MTEKIQQMQQDLEKRGVKFLPWIGEKYEDGIYYNEKGELRYGDNKGEKLLIVSEGIHMDETYKDAFNCVGKEELSYLIHKIIERFIDPQSNFHYGINHRSFIQFERALAGTVQLRLSKRAELWNHVAFYTYIQEPLDSAKLIPTEEQYAKSYDSFKDVIATYKPDVIILWGNRLYNNLCPKEQESQYILIDDYYIEMQILSINNLNVKLLPIWHPSYIGFRHDDWHKIIVEAIKNGN